MASSFDAESQHSELAYVGVNLAHFPSKLQWLESFAFRLRCASVVAAAEATVAEVKYWRVGSEGFQRSVNSTHRDSDPALACVSLGTQPPKSEMPHLDSPYSGNPLGPN